MQSQNRPLISNSFCEEVNAWKSGSISPLTNGTRRVSPELLSPQDLSSTSSTGSPSFSATSTNSSATVNIPNMLDSAATLVWIGFDVKTADYIIDTWLSQRHTTQRPLQLVIEHYIRMHPIKEPCGNASEGNWYVAMRQLGISEKMQEAVMDPEFSLVRTMHPLRYWLEEFLVSNFLSLSNVESRIRSAIKAQQQSGQLPLRGGAGGDRDDYSKKPSGYTTLYRATTTGRLKNVFKEDGTKDLTKTMIKPNSANDFGWDNYGVLFYWTPQMWVADEYARYCERALGFPWDVCVLKMVARPWDVRREDATWELEYSDTWRKLVWYSRNREMYPEDISETYEKTAIFIGPISTNATSVFHRKDDWEKVTEKNVRRQYGSHGDEAIQFMWKGMSAMPYMNSKCDIDLFRWWGKRWLRDPRTWIAGRE